MAKRFTDTAKWQDQWYRELSVKYKCFWQYICDTCDNAGMWKIDLYLANVFISEPINLDEALRVLNKGKERVTLMGEYLRINDFIHFQFGTLNPASKPHKSVLDLLKRHESKGYPKGIHGVSVTPKDKDKEKDKDKDKRVSGDFEVIWERYPRKLGKEDAVRHFKAAVASGELASNFSRALDGYLAAIDAEKTDRKFIMHGSTWFNGKWKDYLTYKPPTQSTWTDNAEARRLERLAAGMSGCCGKPWETVSTPHGSVTHCSLCLMSK